MAIYRGPARTAHGGAYWLTVGWWWEPAKWLGRVTLWLVFFPLGAWRSIRHSRKTHEQRERRGWRTPVWVAPPNWPAAPSGWSPPPGWEPDPAWGPAPAGWQFYR